MPKLSVFKQMKKKPKNQTQPNNPDPLLNQQMAPRAKLGTCDRTIKALLYTVHMFRAGSVKWDLHAICSEK